MSFTREELRKLFRVKKNEINMMAFRGFPLTKAFLMDVQNRGFKEVNLSTFPSMTFEEFLQFRNERKLFQERNEFSTLYVEPGTQRNCLVLYLNTELGKKVNKDNFRLVELAIKDRISHHLIIISQNGLNPDSIGFIEHRMAGYRVETFIDLEFALDPLQHALSPISIRHIPAQETAEWGREEEIQPTQLPIILTTDPIAKRFGGQGLDVFQSTIVGTSVEEQGWARLTRKAPKEKKR